MQTFNKLFTRNQKMKTHIKESLKEEVTELPLWVKYFPEQPFKPNTKILELRSSDYSGTFTESIILDEMLRILEQTETDNLGDEWLFINLSYHSKILLVSENLVKKITNLDMNDAEFPLKLVENWKYEIALNNKEEEIKLRAYNEFLELNDLSEMQLPYFLFEENSRVIYNGQISFDEDDMFKFAGVKIA